MREPQRRGPIVLADAIIKAFAANDRINQFLIGSLDEPAWRAEPPGGKGRCVAAIVSHMHNNRLMWLKMTGHRSGLPHPLDRRTVTRSRALKALTASCQAMTKALKEALGGDGRVKKFPPDVVGFFAYQISHDAHHRGQILMLARQTGHPLPDRGRYGVWHWSKRSKETGLP